MVPGDCCGGGTRIPGSTAGGIRVPRCRDNLSLRVAPAVPGTRSSRGAICSGGGFGALGGATLGCSSCGAAGCGFCAPAKHGNAMLISRPNSSLDRLLIRGERP